MQINDPARNLMALIMI